MSKVVANNKEIYAFISLHILKPGLHNSLFIPQCHSYPLLPPVHIPQVSVLVHYLGPTIIFKRLNVS